MKVGTIPNTTLIRGKQTGEVIITAPATETKLQGIGSLPYFIMADAKILHNIVSRLPESEEVLIDCVDNQIVFRINAYQLKYTPLKIEKL